MDGRKNNGGHSTKGFAGRPTKADEIKIIEQMDAIAVPEDAWRALWEKCQDGDIQAIKCWLNYRFGMPKQVVDVTTQGEKVTPPIEWIKSK
jgi:hypothetical protein